MKEKKLIQWESIRISINCNWLKRIATVVSEDSIYGFGLMILKSATIRLVHYGIPDLYITRGSINHSVKEVALCFLIRYKTLHANVSHI
jgi:hypothetical protein